MEIMMVKEKKLSRINFVEYPCNVSRDVQVSVPKREC
jgi:hypothetical protein